MPKTTLRRGIYRATIVPDRFQSELLFHYVVQRTGSRDVLAWGQERNEFAARSTALRQIEFLIESEEEKSA